MLEHIHLTTREHESERPVVSRRAGEDRHVAARQALPRKPRIIQGLIAVAKNPLTIGIHDVILVLGQTKELVILCVNFIRHKPSE